LKLPFRDGKGSRVALEGASREQGGVPREQGGAPREQGGAPREQGGAPREHRGSKREHCGVVQGRSRWEPETGPLVFGLSCPRCSNYLEAPPAA